MSSHTPGPWRQHPQHPDRIIVNGSCVYQVRDMTTEDGFAGNGFGQPNPSDVALMAAAPELLEIMQTLRGDLHSGAINDAGNIDCFLAEMDAAIAKAEGRGDS